MFYLNPKCFYLNIAPTTEFLYKNLKESVALLNVWSGYLFEVVHQEKSFVFYI